MVLKLDRGQISFSLVENELVGGQLAVLATRIALRHFGPGMHRNQNFEILDEKVTYGFRLFDF